MENVKEIKITFEDGREKVITRGVCFSVIEKGDDISVSLDAISGDETDCVAVMTVISKIADEMGIGKELLDSVRDTGDDNGN